MGKIEWAMWANEQAFASGIILMSGGIMGLFGFTGRTFAIYAIPAGFVVCLFEYPRSRRSKGNTLERKFQRIFNPVMNALGPITQNYFTRFVLYILMCAPCFLQLPLVLGGICLFIASMIYFRAALSGETWKPVGVEEHYRRTITNKPPSVAPPRRPRSQPGEVEGQRNGQQDGGAQGEGQRNQPAAPPPRPPPPTV